MSDGEYSDPCFALGLWVGEAISQAAAQPRTAAVLSCLDSLHLAVIDPGYARALFGAVHRIMQGQGRIQEREVRIREFIRDHPLRVEVEG